MPETHDVAIVGAGPIGLELAHYLQRAGVDYVHLDRGQVGATIAWFPQGMSFFSSNDRIAIGGVPIQTVGQEKSTKEQYLAYLRAFAMAKDLRVRTYVEVTGIEQGDDGRFRLRTRSAGGEEALLARKVVLATGDMDGPRMLRIPGEDLPHVSHYFEEPHRFFRKRLLIVGGRNSAAEAALRCWHAGAEVTVSYRREAFEPKSVKYWLLPELRGRIDRGEIRGEMGTTPVEITPTSVRLRRGRGETFEVDADFVLLLVGYVMDTTLMEGAGVELGGPEHAPAFDKRTMETNVPGLYVAGTATAGTQQRYTVFIENCHIHAKRIAAALTGDPPPDESNPLGLPES